MMTCVSPSFSAESSTSWKVSVTSLCFLDSFSARALVALLLLLLGFCLAVLFMVARRRDDYDEAGGAAFECCSVIDRITRPMRFVSQCCRTGLSFWWLCFSNTPLRSSSRMSARSQARLARSQATTMSAPPLVATDHHPSIAQLTHVSCPRRPVEQQHSLEPSSP